MLEADLFTHHVFLDLETTGLDAARDEVIELGALFVHRGRPVKRISRLFRARKRLPRVIRQLTGIRDEELAGAPAFPGFLPELGRALRGWTVVAHNAAFERSFLSELLSSIDAPVLDSCELLHYLYPELPSHSLQSMIRWADVGERAAHRALRDCEDTYSVLRRALTRFTEEGRGGDLADLLSVLEGNASSSAKPLVTMLRALQGLCVDSPSSQAADALKQTASVGLPPMAEVKRGMTHEERAPRAYLRAVLRRSPEAWPDQLSGWFQVRFPALRDMVLAAQVPAAAVLEEVSSSRGTPMRVPR